MAKDARNRTACWQEPLSAVVGVDPVQSARPRGTRSSHRGCQLPADMWTGAVGASSRCRYTKTPSWGVAPAARVVARLIVSHRVRQWQGRAADDHRQ